MAVDYNGGLRRGLALRGGVLRDVALSHASVVRLLHTSYARRAYDTPGALEVPLHGNYILTGADTPISARPFSSTCRVAASNAMRALRTPSSSTSTRSAL